MINVEAAPVEREPFPHFAIPDFLPAEDVAKAIADFPKIDMGGLAFVFKAQAITRRGHKPFVGPRHSVMLNYCMEKQSRDQEVARRRMSNRVKKFKRLFGIGRIPQADRGGSRLLVVHSGGGEGRHVLVAGERGLGQADGERGARALAQPHAEIE
jgi:hypothetical protein